MGLVPTSFTISKEMAQKLRVSAAQNGVSRSEFVRNLLSLLIEPRPLVLAAFIFVNFNEDEIAALLAELKAVPLEIDFAGGQK